MPLIGAGVNIVNADTAELERLSVVNTEKPNYNPSL